VVNRCQRPYANRLAAPHFWDLAGGFGIGAGLFLAGLSQRAVDPRHPGRRFSVQGAAVLRISDPLIHDLLTQPWLGQDWLPQSLERRAWKALAAMAQSRVDTTTNLPDSATAKNQDGQLSPTRPE
jgi:hypothetical protein